MKSSIFFILTFFFVLVGCEKEELKPLDKYQLLDNRTVNAQVDFCTIEAAKVKSNLKYIFVIDKSGSNQDLSSAIGTDPNGERRYASLQLYLESAPQDETIFYSLVNLSTNATVVSGFTNDKAKFEDSVRHEANPNPDNIPPVPSDGGWTNFQSALKSVNDLISNDIDLAKDQKEVVSSYYVVIFISDGAPWVGTTNLQNKSDILEQVDSLLAFEEGNREYVDSVQLHTAYYYNLGGKDSDAHSYMKSMAENGNGSFFEFGAGQVIDFDRFSVPERNVKHNLRDVLVTNINTKWHKDKDGIDRLFVDSDADGLVDIVENEEGSDSLNPDSDGNGISDGIEFYTTGKACKTLKCIVQGQDPCEKYTCDHTRAEPYAACNSWLVTGNEECELNREEKLASCQETCDFTPERCVEICTQPECPELPTKIGDVPIKRISDLDKDYLNDCEERVVLKSKSDSFDSNDDWIPDRLSFKTSLAFVEGTQGDAILDPDQDKVKNYDEVKKSTPLRYDNNKIYGLRPYKYTLNVKSDNETQTCFRLDVKGIPVGTKDDIIRVYIMENTSIIKNKRFMRSFQRSINDEPVVKFTESDFKF